LRRRDRPLYVFNSASYTGGGSVWVCEHIYVANTSTQRESPACAYNYASASWPGGWPSASEVYVTHWTGNNHSIYGLARY
jgi:hypothetical protein